MDGINHGILSDISWSVLKKKYCLKKWSKYTLSTAIHNRFFCTKRAVKNFSGTCSYE